MPVPLLALGAVGATSVFAKAQIALGANEPKSITATKTGKLGAAKAQWLADFVTAVRPTIDERGFCISVAIGQACVETGYGSAGRKNPWGKRGLGDAGSEAITTTEQIDHVVVKQTGQKFAVYSSPQAAASGYCDFLSGPRYTPAWAWREANPGFWLLWLWGSGYATADHYASAVVDASRNAAQTLGDPSLEVGWTDTHRAIAKQLGDTPAGKQRRALTQDLLTPYL